MDGHVDGEGLFNDDAFTLSSMAESKHIEKGHSES